MVTLFRNDSGIRTAYARSREFQLPDSAEYYFKSVDRLAAPDYTPTDADILFTPSHTTGFNEVVFQSQNERFRVVDVGGQRSERRKWVQCFQDVSAVIFCAALSEYDLTLFEKSDENRTQESLRLFRDVCASKWFTNSHIFLFLNKKDLFDSKVAYSPLATYFPQYTGPNEPGPAAKFMKELFLNTAKCPRDVSVFFTCATNSENIKQVFTAVQATLVQGAPNVTSSPAPSEPAEPTPASGPVISGPITGTETSTNDNSSTGSATSTSAPSPTIGTGGTHKHHHSSKKRPT